jgi:hypothetical protein
MVHDLSGVKDRDSIDNASQETPWVLIGRNAGGHRHYRHDGVPDYGRGGQGLQSRIEPKKVGKLGRSKGQSTFWAVLLGRHRA